MAFHCRHRKGRKSCPSCKEARRLREQPEQKAYRRELTANGLCYCKAPVAPGLSSCEKCLDSGLSRSRSLREWRRQHRRCVRCGKGRWSTTYLECRRCVRKQRLDRQAKKDFRCGCGEPAVVDNTRLVTPQRPKPKCQSCRVLAERIGLVNDIRFTEIIGSMRRNGNVTHYRVSEDIGVSVRSVIRTMKKLTSAGLAERWLTDDGRAMFRLKEVSNG